MLLDPAKLRRPCLHSRGPAGSRGEFRIAAACALAAASDDAVAGLAPVIVLDLLDHLVPDDPPRFIAGPRGVRRHDDIAPVQHLDQRVRWVRRFGGQVIDASACDLAFVQGIDERGFVDEPASLAIDQDRQVYNFRTQDQRMALSLGCEMKFAPRIGYASAFNIDDESVFSQIGINCHLCPRHACTQRAHQPVFMELPIDTTRRGNTRYES